MIRQIILQESQSQFQIVGRSMLRSVSPPTQKAAILLKILIVLTILTVVQGLFLMFTYEYKTITYFASFVIYLITIKNLSYFGCIVNQFINISSIWLLLIEMAIKLKVGLYEVYLSSQGIFKMSSLIFEIVSLYFNFITYKQFKQIAYEIHEEENKNDEDEESQYRNRDRNYRYQ